MNTNNNQKVNNLPSFNKVIKIEVPVQSIYDKLLATFPEDYKHREMVAHAIIGSVSESTSGLSYVYNALSGFTNEIDFQPGDRIICTEKDKHEWYDANTQNEEGEALVVVDGSQVTSKPKMVRRDLEIGECRVTAVNLYSVNKLTVEFTGQSRYNEASVKNALTLQTSNVDHKSCTRIPMYLD